MDIARLPAGEPTFFIVNFNPVMVWVPLEAAKDCPTVAVTDPLPIPTAELLSEPLFEMEQEEDALVPPLPHDPNEMAAMLRRRAVAGAENLGKFINDNKTIVLGEIKEKPCNTSPCATPNFSVSKVFFKMDP